MSKQLLIIGIDPGATAGYAVLDINGKLLKVGSSKDLKLSDLISRIIEIGKPLIVGCDVTPSPRFVEKFSIKTGSRLIVPDKDLMQEEKDQLTMGFKLKNMHQKDALASAFFAYKIIKPLFDKIDKFLKESGKQELADDVRVLVIKNNISIKSAIRILEKPEEEAKEIQKAIEKKVLSEEDFINLYEKLKKSEEEIRLLKQQNQNLMDRAASLEDKNKFLIKRLAKLIPREKIAQRFSYKEKRINALNKEIEDKKSAIASLQNEVIKLNDFISDIRNNVIAKKLDNLGYKEFESKKEKLNIKQGDILLVDDADIYSDKTIDELRNKIQMVIAKKISKKVKFPFTVIDAKNLKIKEMGLFALIDKKTLEAEISKQDILTKVIDEYRKERQF